MKRAVVDTMLFVLCLAIPALLVRNLGARTMFRTAVAFGPILLLIVHSVLRSCIRRRANSVSG